MLHRRSENAYNYFRISDDYKQTQINGEKIIEIIKLNNLYYSVR